MIICCRAGRIGNPRTIQFLFEVSQVLHESIDISNMNDENKQKADLISKFVGMVNVSDLTLRIPADKSAQFLAFFVVYYKD